jgi:NAD(P)-dependent dehydrogenase (short-subunit alcohol dehydrogenase family)
MKANAKSKQVCVVIGATSKWQAEGRNTLLAHGHKVDDSHLPVGVRWGVGGAIAQKFAQEGFFTVLTTRSEANAAPIAWSSSSTWCRRSRSPRPSPRSAARPAIRMR